MLNQFKWANHADGKARCLKGLVQDIKQSEHDGASLTSLDPEVVWGLFREAQEKRQPEEVIKLADTLKTANVKLDRFLQVGVVFAHFNLNQPVQAFEKLVDLYGAGHIVPDRAHDQIAEELAKQASAVDESYFLLESRKTQSLPVPLPAVNMIIEACALMGDLDRAFATWAEIDQLALKPDVGTFNALLHTCVRTREIGSGRRLLSRMAQDGIGANAMTFTHQTALHIMGREEGLALKILQTCKDGGFTPTVKMYASLINMCCRTRKYDRAQTLLQEMEADGHRVTDALRSKVRGAGGGGGGGSSSRNTPAGR